MLELSQVEDTNSLSGGQQMSPYSRLNELPINQG